MTTVYNTTYGQFLYGQKKYGSTATSIDAINNWIVEIDWNGDGIFDGWNEASRLTDIDIVRGRKTMLNSDGSGFFPISPGTCRIALTNHDGRYDAWNTSSPLYPYINYGRNIRVKVKDIASGTTYTLFYGKISDIVPSGYGANAIVKISAVDNLMLLRNNKSNIEIFYSENVFSLIHNFLLNSGWSDPESLEDNGDIIPYCWSDSNKNTADQINRIAQSYMGQFFIANDGTAKYISRNSTSTAGTTYTSSVILKDIGMPLPWINYRNVISTKLSPVKLTDTAFTTVLYNSTSISLKIASSYSSLPYSKTLLSFNYGGSLVAGRGVVSTYTANTAADGTGTDKTTFVVSGGIQEYGSRFYAEFYQTAGVDIYITALRILGDPFEATEQVITYPEDISILPANSRIFDIDMYWTQDRILSRTLTNALYTFLSTLQKFPIIKITNRASYQYGVDLFDLVTATISTLGINSNFRIGGIEHVGTPQDMTTTLYLEPKFST